MCFECWQRYGSPMIDSPKVRKAAKLIEEVYECHSAGGNLHVQLDDWNLENEYFEEYKIYCEENPELEKAERNCFNMLRLLSLQERASALALYEGFWRKEII